MATRNNSCLGLDFVTPTGDIIKAGGRTPKNATGFNLSGLMIGSEGMLGIITRAILRLLPLPETRRTALAIFATAQDACNCVAGFTEAGILPVALELLDRASINAIEDYEPSGMPRSAGALLIIEVDGLKEVCHTRSRNYASICVISTTLSNTAKPPTKQSPTTFGKCGAKCLRRSRRTGAVKINHDIVIPRSRIPAMLAFLEGVSARYGFPIPTFGHAGDGNLHTNVMLPNNEDETKRIAAKAVREIFEKAVELGGTLSGEHGVGYAKAPFLDLALTAPTIAVDANDQTGA